METVVNKNHTHEEIYQFRYVLSHYTRVPHSSYVVRGSGEHSPVDTDDAVFASSQISWKENSTWLQSLLVIRYYKIFPSRQTVWYVRQILKFGNVMLSAFHRQRIISNLIW
jgi:hypothetical protein